MSVAQSLEQFVESLDGDARQSPQEIVDAWFLAYFADPEAARRRGLKAISEPLAHDILPPPELRK